MKDVKKVFVTKYLRNVDESAALVSTAYGISRAAARAISDALTSTADSFLKGLYIDENGSYITKFQDVQNNDHCLLLNKHHKPTRGQMKDECLQNYKEKLIDLKSRIIMNITDNIIDQCSDDTFYYSWSGLDLSLKNLSLEQRVERLSDVIELCCVPKRNTVSKYTNSREKDLEADTWNGFVVKLHHMKFIDVTEEELKEEISDGWTQLSSMWLREVNLSKKKPSQLNARKDFV